MTHSFFLLVYKPLELLLYSLSYSYSTQARLQPTSPLAAIHLVSLETLLDHSSPRTVASVQSNSPSSQSSRNPSQLLLALLASILHHS